MLKSSTRVRKFMQPSSNLRRHGTSQRRLRAALTFASRKRRLIMTHCRLALLLAAVLCAPLAAQPESADPCAALAGLKIDGVEITKAALVPAGTTIPPPYPGAPGLGPFPAHCRVDGIINRRKGIDGQEFGIGFALALPEPATWNSDFMMQGGGGGNGIIAYPAGANYAGDKPALDRKSTCLNSSHANISYAVFCLKKKIKDIRHSPPLKMDPCAAAAGVLHIVERWIHDSRCEWLFLRELPFRVFGFF